MVAIGAPAATRQALSVEEAVQHELKAAGWNPIDAHWYDELRALAILKGAWIRGILLRAKA